jgi:hypothetical protein
MLSGSSRQPQEIDARKGQNLASSRYERGAASEVFLSFENPFDTDSTENALWRFQVAMCVNEFRKPTKGELFRGGAHRIPRCSRLLDAHGRKLGVVINEAVRFGVTTGQSIDATIDANYRAAIADLSFDQFVRINAAACGGISSESGASVSAVNSVIKARL